MEGGKYTPYNKRVSPALVGDCDTSLMVMDRTTMQKINRGP